MAFDEQFLARNCLTISRLFDRALIDAAAAEVEAQYAGVTYETLPVHMIVGDRRAQLPVQLRGPLLDPNLYAHPVMMRMLSALLGPDFLLDSFTCVIAFPGAKDQMLHRDQRDLFMDRQEIRETLPPYAINVAIPLVDQTPLTGATRLFPGSQRLPMAEAATSLSPEDGEMAYVERGGCYLMDYRLVHQGTANRSDAPRPVLYLIYTRPWFTDSENFRKHPRITIDPADFRKIPDQHRFLFRRLAAPGGIDRSEKELMRSEVDDEPSPDAQLAPPELAGRGFR